MDYPRTSIWFLLVGAFLLLSPALLYAQEADEQEVAVEEATTQPSSPSSEQSGGAGSLLVSPTRVLLEGRTRAAEVVLSNQGKKEVTYRISFVQLSMDEKGKYKRSRSTAISADPYLRYSPKQVTLRPGESQIVKVMARRDNPIKSGEYRSHMLFQAVPDASTGDEIEPSQVGEGISVKLVPLFGVSIPVIVRSGDLSSEAHISSASLAGKNVIVRISRSGNKSVFGDMFVLKGGTVIGSTKGVSVFTPNTSREVSVPLKEDASGSVTVQYRERAEDGGKVIAEKQVNL